MISAAGIARIGGNSLSCKIGPLRRSAASAKFAGAREQSSHERQLVPDRSSEAVGAHALDAGFGEARFRRSLCCLQSWHVADASREAE
jgi:hypothetical protein